MNLDQFKEGDVITWGNSDNISILGKRTRGQFEILAWRYNGEWQSPSYYALPNYGEYGLHPEADRIYAEYVAWRLTND